MSDFVGFINWCFCVSGAVWFGATHEHSRGAAIASLGFGALAVLLASGLLS